MKKGDIFNAEQKCKNYLCQGYSKVSPCRCDLTPDGDISDCEYRNDDPSKIKVLDGKCVVKERDK